MPERFPAAPEYALVFNYTLGFIVP